MSFNPCIGSAKSTLFCCFKQSPVSIRHRAAAGRSGQKTKKNLSCVSKKQRTAKDGWRTVASPLDLPLSLSKAENHQGPKKEAPNRRGLYEPPPQVKWISLFPKRRHIWSSHYARHPVLPALEGSHHLPTTTKNSKTSPGRHGNVSNWKTTNWTASPVLLALADN